MKTRRCITSAFLNHGLITAALFLLVLLPFTFIQFFYAPWIEAQAKARTPRVLPEDERGHVILTRYDPVTDSRRDYSVTVKGTRHSVRVRVD